MTVDKRHYNASAECSASEQIDFSLQQFEYMSVWFRKSGSKNGLSTVCCSGLSELAVRLRIYLHELCLEIIDTGTEGISTGGRKRI